MLQAGRFTFKSCTVCNSIEYGREAIHTKNVAQNRLSQTRARIRSFVLARPLPRHVPHWAGCFNHTDEPVFGRWSRVAARHGLLHFRFPVSF